MAESTSSQKRRQRSAARNQRRSQPAEPSEALEEGADTGAGGSPARTSLKYAAMAAAAGAVVAAVAAAAKVLADRRNEAEQQEEQGNGAPPQAEAEPEPQLDARPEPEEAENTEAESPRSSEDEPEPPEETEVEDETQARDEQSSDEPEGGEDALEEASSMPQGASADEITEIVEEAKGKLQELLGAEPERVSGFDRSNGRWTVTLEVVEVHRVPETTDVLASYEVAFDEDRNLVGMSEVRRYLRSQTEEGR